MERVGPGPRDASRRMTRHPERALAASLCSTSVRIADDRAELSSQEDMSPYLAIPGGLFVPDQNEMEGIHAPAGSLYSPMLIKVIG